MLDAKPFQDCANEHEAKLKGENAAVLDAPSSILLLATRVNTIERLFFSPPAKSASLDETDPSTVQARLKC